MSATAVVTGMGFCLPGEPGSLCTEKESFWNIISQGIDCTALDHDQIRHGFIAVDDATLYSHIDDLPEKYFARYSYLQKYALVSLNTALRDAGLERAHFEQETTGLISAVATTDTIYRALHAFFSLDLATASPDDAKYVYNQISLSAGRNDISNVLSDYLRATGSNFAISCGCASSAAALGLAIDKIRSGEWASCVVSASDYYTLEALCHSIGFKKVLMARPDEQHDTLFSNMAMRPYDQRGTGVVFGNGSCTLIVESLEHAQQRGAPHIYGELAQQRLIRSKNATAIALDSSGTQVVRAIQQACSGITEVTDIPYINGGAQGDKIFNVTEAAAFAQLYGDKIQDLIVTSQEGCFGHVGGSIGNIGAAATLLMMQHNTICPTTNCEEVDPLCAFNPLPNNQRLEKQFDIALSINYQAAGVASALLLRNSNPVNGRTTLARGPFSQLLQRFARRKKPMPSSKDNAITTA